MLNSQHVSTVEIQRTSDDNFRADVREFYTEVNRHDNNLKIELRIIFQKN